MQNATCSTDGCTRPAFATGLCMRCYSSQRRLRFKALPCSYPGCELPQGTSRGLCPAHYQRSRAGMPMDVAIVPTERRAPGLQCAVDECVEPAEKRRWCNPHYRQLLRGEAPHKPRWKAASGTSNCLACGAENQGQRKYCNKACYQRFRAERGNVTLFILCERCGETVPLLRAGGRKMRIDTRMCGACRKGRKYRHGMSVAVLAKRDGITCRICFQPVDMTLSYPSPMRPSVDHVLPWALGGTHDPENLQLAHHTCNLSKATKYGFMLLT